MDSEGIRLLVRNDTEQLARCVEYARKVFIAVVDHNWDRASNLIRQVMAPPVVTALLPFARIRLATDTCKAERTLIHLLLHIVSQSDPNEQIQGRVSLHESTGTIVSTASLHAALRRNTKLSLEHHQPLSGVNQTHSILQLFNQIIEADSLISEAELETGSIITTTTAVAAARYNGNTNFTNESSVVNMRTRGGFSPLHLAALLPHVPVEFTIALLRAGADPLVRDRRNNLPLYYALQSPEWKTGGSKIAKELALVTPIDSDARLIARQRRHAWWLLVHEITTAWRGNKMAKTQVKRQTLVLQEQERLENSSTFSVEISTGRKSDPVEDKVPFNGIKVMPSSVSRAVTTPNLTEYSEISNGFSTHKRRDPPRRNVAAKSLPLFSNDT